MNMTSQQLASLQSRRHSPPAGKPRRKILAIDPGNTESAWVLYDGETGALIDFAKECNTELLATLRAFVNPVAYNHSHEPGLLLAESEEDSSQTEGILRDTSGGVFREGENVAEEEQDSHRKIPQSQFGAPFCNTPKVGIEKQKEACRKNANLSAFESASSSKDRTKSREATGTQREVQRLAQNMASEKPNQAATVLSGEAGSEGHVGREAYRCGNSDATNQAKGKMPLLQEGIRQQGARTHRSQDAVVQGRKKLRGEHSNSLHSVQSAEVEKDSRGVSSPFTGCSHFVIEMISSYGMPVGKEVFETCVWIGRFLEAIQQRAGVVPSLMFRRDVKLHLCNSARAKDGEIRQALIDRYGPGKERAIGLKASPGPLYSVKADVWQALALAVTFGDSPAP